MNRKDCLASARGQGQRGPRDNVAFGGLAAPFRSPAWLVQLELEHLSVLEEVIVRRVDGKFPTERR